MCSGEFQAEGTVAKCEARCMPEAFAEEHGGNNSCKIVWERGSGRRGQWSNGKLVLIGLGGPCKDLCFYSE